MNMVIILILVIEDKGGESMDFDEIDLLDLIQNQVEDGKFSFDQIVDFIHCSNRIMYLGDITEGVGSAMDSMIRFWNYEDNKNDIPIEERQPIKIYIDSEGGSLTDTFTIIDAISLSELPVYTIVTGTAYSGGCLVALSGHKRYAFPHASFMLHEGSTSTGGDSHKFINYSKFYQKQLNQLKDIVIKHTNMTDEFYESIKRDDYWLSADEAIEKGIIDEIVEKK